MKDELENKLKEFFNLKSNDITKLKEDVWTKIELETMNKKKRVRTRRRITFYLTVAVLFTVIWIGFSTNTGEALIKNFKDIFVTEKEIDTHIEGEIEETNVGLETNENLDYIIYVDHSNYKLVHGENSDKIFPNEELGDLYPEVSMEIWRENGSVDEVIANIQSELTNQKMRIKAKEEVSSPLKAIMIVAYGESDEADYDWDTPINRFYIVSEEENKQLYIIKQQYFLEATEGHAIRFDTMLEHFKIVKSE